MKNLIMLTLITLTLTSCGGSGGSGSPTATRSTGSGTTTTNLNKSIIVIYVSATNSQLYPFHWDASEYYSLDCGTLSGAPQNNCVTTSLTRAKNQSYDVCVIDPIIPDSLLLQQAKANCKSIE